MIDKEGVKNAKPRKPPKHGVHIKYWSVAEYQARDTNQNAAYSSCTQKSSVQNEKNKLQSG